MIVTSTAKTAISMAAQHTSHDDDEDMMMKTKDQLQYDSDGK